MILDVALSSKQEREMRGLCDWALEDPVAFIDGALGFSPWSKQREIIEAAQHQRAAVRSCHGVGKTATVARVIVTDMVAHGLRAWAYGSDNVRCRVVTTAPVFDPGVKRLLWPEIHAGAQALNRTLRRLGLPTMPTPNQTAWDITPEWFAVGLSTDEPERFQGHHADFLRLVVDEASGVAQAIYNAGRGFLTGGLARVLLIGNPTRTVGEFYRAFRADSKYVQVHVSAFDSPAVTGEPVSDIVRQAMPKQSWIDDMVDDYGEEHPEFAIRVLGDFSETTGHVFFNPRHLQRIVPAEPVRRGEVDAEDDVWLPLPHGRLWVWEAPRPLDEYVVTVDPAGLVTKREREAFVDPKDVGDDVCIQVVAAADGRQIAEFLGRIDPDHAARIAALLGARYNRALLSVEKQGGYGDAVIVELRRVGYTNLFHRKTFDRKRQREVAEVGWTTTRTTRDLMLSTARRVLRESPSAVRSERLLRQLRKFVVNDLGNPEADAGEHDDAVLAWAQAQEVRRQRFEKKQQAEKPEPGLEERAMAWGRPASRTARRRVRRMRAAA